MTEIEAIETLRAYKEVVDRMIDYCREFEPKEDISGYLKKKETFEMAIHALEEIQQYRKNGKVLNGSDLSGLELANIWIKLERLKKYEAIGSVEECCAAMEKQKPKKPVKRSFIIPYKGIDVCPGCKEPINKKQHHCKCGQAIDWSEGN